MLDLDTRELAAAQEGARRAASTLPDAMGRTAPSRVRPLWQRALESRARTRGERATILPGATATASKMSVRLTAAASSRPLYGGLVPSQQWGIYEYGQRGRGAVAMPAAGEVGRQVVALWVHDIVDELGDIPGAEVVR